VWFRHNEPTYMFYRVEKPFSYGIKSRNIDQSCALDSLLNDDI
ncbi:MAG: putative ribonuclease YlaK, partial [Psychromonas sp.]